MIENSDYTLLGLSLFIWLVSFTRETVFYAYYWQLKEYRWDRMHDFLSSKKGKSLIASAPNAFRFLLIILVAVYFFDPVNIYSPLVLWLLLGVLGVINLANILLNYKRRTLYRPKLTAKMALILLGAFLVEGLIWFLFREQPISVLVLDIVRPFTVTLVMSTVGIPFLFLKKHLIYKATKRRKNLNETKIIGITGSYGKSSTKEFLCKILEQKFKVAKTPKHVNVDIGVAQVLLNQVTAEDEVFVVEMGAYREGEIKAICDIVKPDIGIVTGINEQHLSFFGSIENTIRTKAELLAALPKDGVAIINADNENTHQALKYNNAEKVLKYGVEDHHEIRATNIVQKQKVLKFKVHYNHKTADFEVPVFGTHYVQNLLACIACATELGLSLKEIAEFAKSCEVLEGSLQIHDGKKGSTVIDDSYNANPDGFLAALNAVHELKSGKTILVTPGMMELGSKSEEIHRRVGQRIAEICDTVIVTSEDSYEVLCSTIYEFSKKTEVLFETDHEKLIKLLKNKLKKNNLVLFENRVPKVVIDSCKKQ